MLAYHDDKVVAVAYRYNQTSGKSLQWCAVDSTDWADIDLATIVGLVPSGDEEEACNLLVLRHGNDKDTTASPSLQIIELGSSEELVRDFRQPESSLLKPRDGVSIHVVVSAGSGTGKAKDFYTQALKPLLELVIGPESQAYKLHMTISESSITKLAHQHIIPAANSGHQQTIILLSGDGGLVDVLNAVYSEQHNPQYRNPDIALLPLGTGNALANSSGILNDKTLGLRTLLEGTPHAIPVFQASFSPGARYLVDEARHEESLQLVDNSPTAYGCVVCSWGLHAALVADSDTVEYRKFGAERFKMAAKENIFPPDGSLPHAYSGRLQIIKQDSPDNTWQSIDRSEHGYVLSTLVSHLESGFNISPHSKPLDGILRLVHFEALSGKDAMDAMSKAYQGGQHINDDRIGYEAVKALRIEFNEEDAHWRRVCIDGKIVRVEKGGWLEVRTNIPAAVNLITI